MRGLGAVDVQTYEGATHALDDPGAWRQSRGANRRATADECARVDTLARQAFGKP